MAASTRIATRIWRDPNFRRLGLRAGLAAIGVMTYPDAVRLGTVDLPTLADALELRAPEIADAIDELTTAGFLHRDERGTYTVTPMLLAFVHPQSHARFVAGRA